MDWPKELHFFDEHYGRGLDWYRTFFPLAAERKLYRMRGRDIVAGEATPYYLFHEAVPARVVASVPDVRLIALLRDPIERAYSHYQLMRRTGREKLSFADAIAAEEKRLSNQDLTAELQVKNAKGDRVHHHHRHRAYLSRGLYADQLERWFAHFPREQLLVIRAEDGSGRLIVRCDTAAMPIISVQYIPKPALPAMESHQVTVTFDSRAEFSAWEFPGGGAYRGEPFDVWFMVVAIASSKTIRVQTDNDKGETIFSDFAGPGNDAMFRKVYAACGFPYEQPKVGLTQ